MRQDTIAEPAIRPQRSLWSALIKLLIVEDNHRLVASLFAYFEVGPAGAKLQFEAMSPTVVTGHHYSPVVSPD